MSPNHHFASHNKLAQTRVTYTIQNMDCPTEEGLIRSSLTGMKGVESLHFNLMQRQLTVEHTLPAPEPIRLALLGIGMDAVALEDGLSPGNQSNPGGPLSRWYRISLAALAAFAAEIVAWRTGDEQSFVVIALALAGLVLAGSGTYKKGWFALKARNLNINALMSIAVTGAVIIGQWPEAAMVMVLFTLAEMIEALSMDRARNAIEALLTLAPDTALVRHGDGHWHDTPTSQVKQGSVLRVAPGVRVPLDGIVIAGETTIDQAPITGESMPVPKSKGDVVFAGTLNQAGSFDYRATNDKQHSTLTRIIDEVQRAQASKAPAERFIDRFSALYTPVVVVLAVVVAVMLPLVFSQSWADSIYKALVLLVIACPCALVISTPITIVSALAAAAKQGILIKGGLFLEQGRHLRAIAFDKTGTITHGRPVVTDVVALSGSVEQYLSRAGLLAARSRHPVSEAITAYCKTNVEKPCGLAVVAATELPGMGITGRIEDQCYYLGSHRQLHREAAPQAEKEVGSFENQGKTVVVLSSDTAVLMVIAVADTVRDNCAPVLAQLRDLGVHTVMLTGDNPQTAQAVARQVGIEHFHANLLPHDKLKAMDALLAKFDTVGMVGDGINDAPALAKASIGFAMGSAGSDTAIEAADVALMGDDLSRLPVFVRISRHAASVLTQNIVIALGIKVIFLGLAISGGATLWMAVFADMGASLIVIFNGLRLLRSGGRHKIRQA